ncbi:MAG: hypothetical protein ACK4WH_11670, partial [Phycisphaerales bacterium]
MSSSIGSLKFCVHCRRDCSGRPRLRDQHGRYHCRECVDRLGLAHRPAAVEVGTLAAGGSDHDDGPIPLVEESDEPRVRGDVCAGCSRPISPEAAVCIQCGLNRQTGERIATALEVSKELRRKSKRRTCRECGANLTGLAAPRCPSCGTVELDSRLTREERQREEGRRLARNAWLKPLMIAAPTLALMCVVIGLTGGASQIVPYLISFMIQLAIGTVVYFVCAMMWIGVDDPPHIIFLKMAGVYAVYHAAYI